MPRTLGMNVTMLLLVPRLQNMVGYDRAHMLCVLYPDPPSIASQMGQYFKTLLYVQSLIYLGTSTHLSKEGYYDVYSGLLCMFSP